MSNEQCKYSPSGKHVIPHGSICKYCEGNVADEGVLSAETSKPADLLWIRQEDVNGCVVATLAMLTGDTYGEVRAAFSAHDFSKTGCCSEFEACNYLRDRGFAYQKMYKHNGLTKTDRDEWPLLWSNSPLLVGYMAQVILGDNFHAVAVRPNGTVLDPWREGEYRLTDYTQCNHLIAVFNIRGIKNPAAHISEVERLTKERDEWQDKYRKAMRGLESLTPSGSEYVGDVERCVDYAKRARHSLLETVRKAMIQKRDIGIRAEAAESKLSQLQLSNEEKARKIWEMEWGENREDFMSRAVAILNGGQQ